MEDKRKEKMKKVVKDPEDALISLEEESILYEKDLRKGIQVSLMEQN